MQRRRFKQTLIFPERLSQEAEHLCEQAEAMPPGNEREELLRKARQAETASHINEWLSSPGLQSRSKAVSVGGLFRAHHRLAHALARHASVPTLI
jgi:hypothetical protein